MSREQQVRTSDLEKLSGEVRTVTESLSEKVAQIVAKEEARVHRPTVERILTDELSGKISHMQGVAAEAVAQASEAQKQTGLYEERLVRVKAEIGELSKERNDLQAAVDGLRTEYDGLLPKVQELRAEQESYVRGVQRIAKGA